MTSPLTASLLPDGQVELHLVGELGDSVRAVVSRSTALSAAWHVEGAAYGTPRPKIVVLCGRTVHREAYRAANAQETLAGHVVLTCGVFKGDSEWGDEAKVELDQLHRRKIEMADELLLIEPDDLGDSSRAELAYAQALGLPVRYFSLNTRPESAGAIYDAYSVTSEVLNERLRQISSEGWTPEHDDAHIGGELARAGAFYARTTATASLMTDWPWDRSWYKPTGKRRDLVKAAALLIAEIERLDRLDERQREELVFLREQATTAETYNADGAEL